MANAQRKAAAKKAAAKKAAAKKFADEKVADEKAAATSKVKALIIRELEALSIGYDDKMTPEELQALLDDKTSKTKPEVKQEAPARVAAPQAKEVPLGAATINDHEQRIFALEQQLK